MMKKRARKRHIILANFQYHLVHTVASKSICSRVKVDGKFESFEKQTFEGLVV